MTATEPSAMPMVSNFEILDEAECMRLLGSVPIGRVALTAAALPVVLPVNFITHEHTIVFASDPGLKLEAARAGQIACLEVDGYEVVDHTGWSVLATGRLAEITNPERLDLANRLPLSPWALSHPHHFVELSIELLSGRRIKRP